MTLLSDAIFGNGISEAGEEDISVQCDDQGFPYYRGSTFKGIFREELKRYLIFSGKSDKEAEEILVRLLGKPGNSVETDQAVFSDFVLSGWVRNKVREEVGENSFSEVRDALTNVRTFTAMDEGGMIKSGSLRMARCVNKGLTFYSTVDTTAKADEEIIRETLGMVKWIGTMRNRGFGKVRLEEV